MGAGAQGRRMVTHRFPIPEELDRLLGRTKPEDPVTAAHRLADNLRSLRRDARMAGRVGR